jgi:hypothetical protein
VTNGCGHLGYPNPMTQRDTVRRLLEEAGPTYAAEAGIKLADQPAPLYRLLVLSVLLSTRIRAGIAVDAARELRAAGMGTPRAMADATWQQRVDALGRAHYKRYDEQTATALGEGARYLLDEHGGDLRRVREAANGEFRTLARMLRKVPRLGPVGPRSSPARCSWCGRSFARTWTGKPCRVRKSSVCRRSRGGSRNSSIRVSWPTSRRRSCGSRSSAVSPIG